GKKVVSTVSYQLPADKPEVERTEIWLTALDGTGTKRVPAGSVYAEGQPFCDPVTDEIGSFVGDRKRSWVQYWHPETGKPSRKLEFPRGLPACGVSARNGTRFLVSEP